MRRPLLAGMAGSLPIAEALPRDGSVAEAGGEQLAHYVKDVVRHLETESLSALRAGEVEFPEISREYD
jgi:hypothetical protein